MTQNQQADKRRFTVEGVSFNMVRVTGGTFLMGSNDASSKVEDKPQHEVVVSDYMIGEQVVTQELWEVVMGSNPSFFKGAKHPVESVSWNDCQTFIRKLNEVTGQQFRLPTEAEWEYAARGGNCGKGCHYAGSDTLDSVAWYYDNANDETHPVGQKNPNELGLYDMSGNVWEWCSDWFAAYNTASQSNPQGPSAGFHHVYRGGSWYCSAKDCTVSYRNSGIPDHRNLNLGLRLTL